MRRALFVVLLVVGGLVLYAAAQRGSVSAPVPDEPVKGPAFKPGRRALGAAVAIGPLRGDATYRSAYAQTFDSLTPENEMKWERVQPSITRFTFGDADRLVEWAVRHGKRVRGHPLVWDQQIPGWLAERSWKARDLQKVVRDHVNRVVRRYRGRVESWDVVNEPFEGDGSWSTTLFHNVLGDGFVEDAFRVARAADPHARLFLNELGAERPGPKQDALFELVKALKGRGAPIDGVGFQNHTEAATAPTRKELARTIDRFAALGVDVEITEMDVRLGAGDPAAAQAGPYVDAALACQAAARCTGLTVWGVTDKYSWVGSDERATLFDAQGHPKPAHDALLRAWGR